MTCWPSALHLHLPFERSDIVSWFRLHHPDVGWEELNTLIKASTEHPFREGYFGSLPPLRLRLMELRRAV